MNDNTIQCSNSISENVALSQLNNNNVQNYLAQLDTVYTTWNTNFSQLENALELSNTNGNVPTNINISTLNNALNAYQQFFSMPAPITYPLYNNSCCYTSDQMMNSGILNTNTGTCTLPTTTTTTSPGNPVIIIDNNGGSSSSSGGNSYSSPPGGSSGSSGSSENILDQINQTFGVSGAYSGLGIILGIIIPIVIIIIGVGIGIKRNSKI